MAARRSSSGNIELTGIPRSRTKLPIYPIKEGYYLLVAIDRTKPMGRAVLECKRAVRKIEQQMG
jgi:predicted regulator of Ras-like GTPase activity (Roadblock/LC7/MglB family)